MDEDIKVPGLHGKNVVVIGGSRGLGRSLVAAAYAQGAQVLAVARQQEPPFQARRRFFRGARAQP